jgi:hypothetical protein
VSANFEEQVHLPAARPCRKGTFTGMWKIKVIVSLLFKLGEGEGH